MSHPTLQHTSHRPWPVPKSPWIMQQSWHDLLFAHWSYPIDVIRAVLPPQLPLDTFDGKAWIGVVPFRIEGLRPRGLPGFPAVSNFPELNLRTYVTLDGKPGVYFFSLDAGNKLAVIGARALFHLNYYHAVMSVRRGPRGVEFLSRRVDRRGKAADFSARYNATGKGAHAQPGTLNYFLTERYCLYAVSAQQHVYRLEIHHPPWLLQPAEAELDARPLMAAASVPPPMAPALLHFSVVQEMINWAPVRV